MPEGERLAMLSHLAASREETERALAALSITATTLRAKKERAAVEARLDEIAQAEKIFSRKAVLVRA